MEIEKILNRVKENLDVLGLAGRVTRYSGPVSKADDEHDKESLRSHLSYYITTLITMHTLLRRDLDMSRR